MKNNHGNETRSSFGSKSRKICLSLVVVLSLMLAANTAAQTREFPGLLGMGLVEAQKTDFFQFFHLTETGREKDTAKRTVVSFKPSGTDFQKVVTVRTTLDSKDELVQIDLYLSRAFVNDRKQRVFANDISKSMLMDAPSAADRPSLTILANEIASNQGTDSVVLTGRPPASTPIKESPGYLTYLGKRYVHTQELSTCTLQMENVKLNGEDWLEIQFSVK